MNILESASAHGTYKRVSNAKGGEYQGPCPLCGGTDRFHVWPEQDAGRGSYWCRGCNKGGDAIQYLITYEAMTFKTACQAVGKNISKPEEYQAPQFRSPAAVGETYTPRITTVACEQWIQHATKFVDWAHEQLLNNPEQLAWLALRGLPLAAVSAYRLGWNHGERNKDLYRARESWGLETVITDKQKPKKLWLPVGLVIPYIIDNTIQRVRIRRPEGEPRYYLVPGSNTAPMIVGAKSRAYVITESELDALMIHHLAGDICGAISQGNSTAKPDTTASAHLHAAQAILVSLDSDTAGMVASQWWQQQYAQAERWPVPVGKDPGEAYASGVDIRAWILAGLPPALTMPVAPAAEPTKPQAVQPTSNRIAQVHAFAAKDGRQFFVTDDPTEYQRIAAAGQIVFDSREIAFVRLSGADQDQAAAFLNAKQIFHGARISRVDLDQPTQKKERR